MSDGEYVYIILAVYFISVVDVKKSKSSLADIYELTNFIIIIFKRDIYAILDPESFMFPSLYGFSHIGHDDSSQILTYLIVFVQQSGHLTM